MFRLSRPGTIPFVCAAVLRGQEVDQTALTPALSTLLMS